MKNSFKLSLIAFAAIILLTGCKKPQACIDFAPEKVEVNQPFTMNSCSIDSKDYEWNMGDGTTISGSTATHTYTNYGIYSVQLTAIRGGKENTATKAIQVVSTADKYLGSYVVNENCEGSLDSYVVNITEFDENSVWIHNFLNQGWDVLADVDGTSINIPWHGLMEASGSFYDILYGSGTYSNGNLQLSWTVSDQAYDNVEGVFSCSGTFTAQ